jgi:hypothetical protein
MGWLRFIFLENLIAFGVVAFLANFALLVYWRRGGRPRPLLVGLALTLILLIIHVAVDTRREIAIDTLARIERDLEDGVTTHLRPSLADSFEAYGYDRDAFVAFVESKQRHINLERVDLLTLTLIESETDRFTVRAYYRAEAESLAYRNDFLSQWRLRFVRSDAGWRIDRVTALSPDWGLIERAR